jgi:hypothetical protein
MAEDQPVISSVETSIATQPNLEALQAQLEKAKQELALEKMTERVIYEEGEKKTKEGDAAQLAELENAIDKAA